MTIHTNIPVITPEEARMYGGSVEEARLLAADELIATAQAMRVMRDIEIAVRTFLQEQSPDDQTPALILLRNIGLALETGILPPRKAT